MTLYVTHRAKTNNSTEHTAYRLAGQWDAAWRLSWLPDRLLIHEQALAGMDLAEIFASDEFRYDPVVRARAVLSARVGSASARAAMLNHLVKRRQA